MLLPQPSLLLLLQPDRLTALTSHAPQQSIMMAFDLDNICRHAAITFRSKL